MTGTKKNVQISEENGVDLPLKLDRTKKFELSIYFRKSRKLRRMGSQRCKFSGQSLCVTSIGKQLVSDN